MKFVVHAALFLLIMLFPGFAALSQHCTLPPGPHPVSDEGGRPYWLKFYNDANGNCMFDTGEKYVNSVKRVVVSRNGVLLDTLTCLGGGLYKELGVVGDIFTFQVLPFPGQVPTCPLSGIVNDTLVNDGGSSHNIAFQCTGGNNFDLSLHAITRPRPQNMEMLIYPFNDLCYPQNATVTLSYSAYNFVSSVPPPVSQSAGTVTWSVSNLSTFSTSMIKATFNSGTYATGTPIVSSFTITPSINDLNPGNNSKVVTTNVVGGWDPNAIYVKPEGCVAAGTELEYTITFENMGDGVAEHIFVIDTLPQGLDENSFELLFASHPMTVEKTNVSGYTVLRFDYPDIMLPDSSSPDRHGMVRYKIKAAASLAYGFNMHHRASIFFDFNPPVLTDYAHTFICWPQNVETTTSASGGQVLIYPNPATDELTIEADGSFTAYTITNNLGQVMISEKLKGKTTHSISSLPAGVYYITVEGEKGRETLKFVKL